MCAHWFSLFGSTVGYLLTTTIQASSDPIAATLLELRYRSIEGRSSFRECIHQQAKLVSDSHTNNTKAKHTCKLYPTIDLVMQITVTLSTNEICAYKDIGYEEILVG